MSLMIRLILIVGAVLTTVYFGMQIKKNKIDINDAIYWIVFSIFLILLSIFPQIIIFAAHILYVQSPVNLLFLIIIFLLFIREFIQTTKISKLENDIKKLTQQLALKENKEEHD